MCKWISAKKRLPPIAKTVLLYPYPSEDYTDISMGCFNGGKWNKWYDNLLESYRDDVTHWAELLAPPKKRKLAEEEAENV